MNINESHLAKTTEDADLVCRAQTGDAEAVNELLARYHNMLASRIKLWLGHDSAGEDCLQEAELKIALNITLFEYRGVRSLHAWMSLIAHNVAVDYLKKKNPCNTPSQLPIDEDGKPIDVPMPDPRSVGSVVADKEADDVTQLVRDEMARNRIPRRHKQVLRLKFFDGLEGPELANSLGCQHGAARMRIKRALDWIRDHLSKVSKIRNAGQLD